MKEHELKGLLYEVLRNQAQIMVKLEALQNNNIETQSKLNEIEKQTADLYFKRYLAEAELLEAQIIGGKFPST